MKKFAVLALAFMSAFAPSCKTVTRPDGSSVVVVDPVKADMLARGVFGARAGALEGARQIEPTNPHVAEQLVALADALNVAGQAILAISAGSQESATALEKLGVALSLLRTISSTGLLNPEQKAALDEYLLVSGVILAGIQAALQPLPSP